MNWHSFYNCYQLQLTTKLQVSKELKAYQGMPFRQRGDKCTVEQSFRPVSILNAFSNTYGPYNGGLNSTATLW